MRTNNHSIVDKIVLYSANCVLFCPFLKRLVRDAEPCGCRSCGQLLSAPRLQNRQILRRLFFWFSTELNTS